MVRIIFPVGWFIPVLAFQPAHFVQYLFAYIVGVTFAKNNLLETLQLVPLERFILCVIPVLGLLGFVIINIMQTHGDITFAFGGFNIYSVLYSIFDLLMFTFMSLGLIGIYKKYFNKSNSLLSWMGQYTFSTYVMHSSAIAISVILINHFFTLHWLSFVLVCLLSIFLSFALGRLTKSILG